MDQLIAKARTLSEALPYIRRFYGRTFVVKYGGSAMGDRTTRESVMRDLVLLKYIGINPVVVHGGGPEITALLKRLGKETSFVNGRRVTDDETMEVAQMVLVGKVNKELVNLINLHGGRAIGLSGLDAGLIRVKPAAGGTLGRVGEVVSIDPEPLHVLSREGYLPVIATVGVGPDGESYNINADLVAGDLAVALGAEKLIMLTDVEGLRADPADPGSLLPAVTAAEAKQLVESGAIEGGMIPKVEACVRAAEGGVARTHIIDGRVLHALLLEIFTDRGIGTMVQAG
ncbi:MAG: acetylglutamate kinase [Bacillota bacterium]|nr:acetylglutamate kinase [Bacillota bacterium]